MVSIFSYASWNCLDMERFQLERLNLGFNNSTGELCGYINSDDFLLKNSLEKVNDYFIKYPNVDLIYGNGVIVDETSLFKRRMISRDFNLNSYRFGRSLICQQSTFFRKKPASNRANWSKNMHIVHE